MGGQKNRFERLTFKSFSELASREDLSCFEKIGFPDDYRKGFEEAIFADICGKLAVLGDREKTIVDIGPGCSGLPLLLIGLCERQGHRLVLVDSAEMLNQLPDRPFIEKHAGRFPECPGVLEEYSGKVDGILIYSVLQHVFLELNPFVFLDKAVSLLREGGSLLLGDLPNITKRKRFFASPRGMETHKRFTGGSEPPVVDFMKLDEEKIDDAAVMGILQRYRGAGYETYLLPQGPELPLATRREDILIVRN